MGRRFPFMGSSGAPINHVASVSRDATRREVPPVRSEHGRGSESHAHRKSNSSSSNKASDSRAANGAGGEAMNVAHEDVRKKADEGASKYSKRSRTEDQGASSKIPCAKPIFVDGVNQKEKADSFWDLSDPEIGWKKGRSIVGDFDMLHLMSQSTDSFAHSLAWNCCQSKLQDEVTQLKEERRRLSEEKEKANIELLQVQRKLADKLKDFTILEEKHATELKTGGQFLGSEAGKAFLKSMEGKCLETYKASAAFSEVVLDRAMVLHDEMVLDRRRQLRETGLVPEEVVMMLEPDVLEVGVGLVDPLGDAEMIEALNLLPLGDDA